LLEPVDRIRLLTPEKGVDLGRTVVKKHLKRLETRAVGQLLVPVRQDYRLVSQQYAVVAGIIEERDGCPAQIEVAGMESDLYRGLL
jgi:hypothetical protein